jgi:hypothetical protein
MGIHVMASRLARLVALALQPVGTASAALATAELILVVCGFSLTAALIGGAIGVVRGFGQGVLGGLFALALIMLALLTRASYRLLVDADREQIPKARLKSDAERLHSFISECHQLLAEFDRLDLQTITQADWLQFQGRFGHWLVHVVAFVTGAFSKAEASVLEHQLGTSPENAPLATRMREAIVGRLDYLKELQQRIAARMWDQAGQGRPA